MHGMGYCRGTDALIAAVYVTMMIRQDDHATAEDTGGGELSSLLSGGGDGSWSVQVSPISDIALHMTPYIMYGRSYVDN